MTRTSTAVCCALGVSMLAGAAGQAATVMRLQVSPAGAETWTSSIGAKPGDAIDIRVTLSYTGSANPLGLSSTIFQPTISNWHISADAVAPMANVGGNTTTPSGAVPDAPGQYGRISPFAGYALPNTERLFAHVHPAGPTTGGISFVRIAQHQVTSWFGGPGNTNAGSGVNIKQWNVQSVARTLPTPPPAFVTQLTDVVVFKFKVVLSSSTATRTMVVDAPLEGIFRGSSAFPYVGWYGNPIEETPSIRDLPTIERAFILVPGPGSLAVLAGLGLISTRRKR